MTQLKEQLLTPSHGKASTKSKAEQCGSSKRGAPEFQPQVLHVFGLKKPGFEPFFHIFPKLNLLEKPSNSRKDLVFFSMAKLELPNSVLPQRVAAPPPVNQEVPNSGFQSASWASPTQGNPNFSFGFSDGKKKCPIMTAISLPLYFKFTYSVCTELILSQTFC